MNLAKEDIALSTLNQYINAVKFYYERVLKPSAKGIRRQPPEETG